ncbi:hypothetical protein GP486_004483, partial [Trichoglossum hirsutum]
MSIHPITNVTDGSAVSIPDGSDNILDLADDITKKETAKRRGKSKSGEYTRLIPHPKMKPDDQSRSTSK